MNSDNSPILIVMLTKNDRTVKNATEIFEACKNSSATHWGFKEEGIPHDEMKSLFTYMKSCGKTTALEIVAYTQEECLKGAETAAECGCDILMGTVFFDSVNELCKKHGIKYMPFVGDVSGRPSILNGKIDGIVEEAKECIEKGAFGIDLLGYRYTGDAHLLNESLVRYVDSPVCIAGSVDSIEKLEEIRRINPWGFTIGGAFFDGVFGKEIPEQIEFVSAYISQR